LFEVPLDGITSVSNFMKIYQAVLKLLVGDTQIDKPIKTHTGDLISLLSISESKLKMTENFSCMMANLMQVRHLVSHIENIYMSVKIKV
jgi:hypothetical protein